MFTILLHSPSSIFIFKLVSFGSFPKLSLILMTFTHEQRKNDHCILHCIHPFGNILATLLAHWSSLVSAVFSSHFIFTLEKIEPLKINSRLYLFYQDSFRSKCVSNTTCIICLDPLDLHTCPFRIILHSIFV